MKAIVVYESLWGNTAAIARFIAEGFGNEACTVSTKEATPEVLKGADLLIVGSPVLGFTVTNDRAIEAIKANPGNSPEPPDLSQPSMHSWLDSLEPGGIKFAAFETRVVGPWGKATSGIEDHLKKLGYKKIAEGHQFIVESRYGPLKYGEVERAQEWGAELRRAFT
jgi:flavodoxin